MKHIVSSLMTAIFVVIFATSASAEGLHPFTKDAYYGNLEKKTDIGQPAYYRSNEAYELVKAQFERQLGYELTPQAFVNLLASEQVELRSCYGYSIRSMAVGDDGQPAQWTERPCAADEQLAWLIIPGRGAVPLVSLKCLNPLDMPVLPAAERVAPAVKHRSDDPLTTTVTDPDPEPQPEPDPDPEPGCKKNCGNGDKPKPQPQPDPGDDCDHDKDKGHDKDRGWDKDRDHDWDKDRDHGHDKSWDRDHDRDRGHDHGHKDRDHGDHGDHGDKGHK